MRSENISELAAALSKAQGCIGGATKDSLNPHFKSKYADLESVWDACRIPLSKNNLAVTQTIEVAGLVTTLMHSSGQWIDSTHPLIPVDQKPQSLGSCLSYARRYSLAAMVGIYQVDDDAELASGRFTPTPGTQGFAPTEKPIVANPQAPQKTPVAPLKPVTQPKPGIAQPDTLEANRLRVLDAAKKAGWLPENVGSYIAACYGVTLVRDLTPEQITFVIKTVSTNTHVAAMDELKKKPDSSFDFGENDMQRIK